MNKKLLALALIAGVSLAGCGNEANEAETKEDTKVETSQTETKVDDADDKLDDADDKTDDKAATSDSSDIKAVKVSLDDAVKAYKDEFGSDVLIESIKLEKETGSYEYDIDGYFDGKEHSLVVDANTGDVKNKEEDNDDGDEQYLDLASVISPNEAIDKALEGQDGAKVVEWELSVDDGKTYYEIDVENGSDKNVDAITGEVFDD